MFLSHLRFAHLCHEDDGVEPDVPLSPLMAQMVTDGRKEGVGLEALVIACLLEAGAATFLPFRVAPLWCKSI